MLKTAELDFTYPEKLVATSPVPRGHSRILLIPRDKNHFEELTWDRFLAFFKRGDTLVFNDTKVLWARLEVVKPSGKKGEIFYLSHERENRERWQVLTKGLNWKEGQNVDLPGSTQARVVKVDRVSELEILGNRWTLSDLESYFEKWGQVPLPPYIQSLRAKGETLADDRNRYQTVWAKNAGAVAAPTAGLHFTQKHIQHLQTEGVKIVYITLHVGAGTFLPVDTEWVEDFQIHPEFVEVSHEVCESIRKSQAAGRRVWACGTTVLRALESAVWASGTGASKLPLIAPFKGETKLLITPGYKFLVVNGLLTNFHQPQSSLLALASAFASHVETGIHIEASHMVQKLLEAYQYAIARDFRLFSYGDLTVMV